MGREKADLYRDQLAQFRLNVSDLGFDPPDGRVEHVFETLRDWSLWHDLDQVRVWFLDRRSKGTMRVEDIPLNETRGWTLDPASGDVRHESGDFFTVHGIRVSLSTTREVGELGWDQPIVEQVGLDGGILGIVMQRQHGVPHYLIEAKAEPGNYEIVQMSPTLQATFANLRRAHGGRRPRFADIFETPERFGASALYAQWMSEDGGRLHKKRNFGMLVEVPQDMELDYTDDFIWMSMYQVKACLQENAWVNPHLRGVIAHL